MSVLPLLKIKIARNNNFRKDIKHYYKTLKRTLKNTIKNQVNYKSILHKSSTLFQIKYYSITTLLQLDYSKIMRRLY